MTWTHHLTDRQRGSLDALAVHELAAVVRRAFPAALVAAGHAARADAGLRPLPPHDDVPAKLLEPFGTWIECIVRHLYDRVGSGRDQIAWLNQQYEALSQQAEASFLYFAG